MLIDDDISPISDIRVEIPRDTANRVANLPDRVALNTLEIDGAAKMETRPIDNYMNTWVAILA